MEVLREGYRILFSRGPLLSDQPLPMPSYSPSSIRGKALEKEFLDLLHKRAIEQAPQTPGFYSRLFVVQKDSGSWRPIIDLSTLNTFIVSLPDVNSSDHGPDSSANTLQMDETEGDMIHCRPSPLAMLLVYMPASFQSPPSHWPSPHYDDFISSGLRALYRCPLRGPPISPARRGNGSCNCVRS